MASFPFLGNAVRRGEVGGREREKKKKKKRASDKGQAKGTVLKRNPP